MSPLRYAPDAATAKTIEDLGAERERAISRRSNLSLSPAKLLVSTSLSATLLDLYQHIKESQQLKDTRAQPYLLITNLILPMYILWRELQM